MSQHPNVLAAMHEAIEIAGTDSGGTRNFSGTTHYHAELEAELADLHGKEAALLFTSALIANDTTLATLQALLPGLVIVSDAQNHASMIATPRTGAIIIDGRKITDCCTCSRRLMSPLQTSSGIPNLPSSLARVFRGGVMAELSHVRTSVLDIGYEHSGPAEAPVIVLLHGYPFDVRAFDGVVPIVNAAGFRTVVPYLRGHGPTRFLSAGTMRSGEQAALGMDLLELLDALKIRQALLAGFDWGGRAACVVSALWPERSRGLVTCTGYQIQDIANSDKPADPEQERRFWYQYYFNTGRGRKGLTQMRNEIGQLLWKLWSPNWVFDEDTYRQTAKSFDNADFVDVVIHSYMHRVHNAAGDPRYAQIEAQLASLPKISIPTIVIHGADDEVNPVKRSEGHHRFFTGPYERRVFENVGHNPPQEAPEKFARAILDLCDETY